MTSDTSTAASNLFPWPLNFMLPGGFPPSSFAPNPGWTFGNVVINTTNSTAPGVEQTVVSRHSYGRQIGRLIDAVEALVAQVPAVQTETGVEDFIALAQEIREIKARARASQLERLHADLQDLKREDNAAWRRLMAQR